MFGTKRLEINRPRKVIECTSNELGTKYLNWNMEIALHKRCAFGHIYWENP